MPDPEQSQSYTYQQFAEAIRATTPELAHISDDGMLTHAVLATHPEYKGVVIDPLEGTDAAKAPQPLGPAKGFQLGTPPPPGMEDQPPVAPLRSAKTGPAQRGTQPAEPPAFPQGQEELGKILASPVTGAQRFVKGITPGLKEFARTGTYAPPPGTSLMDTIGQLSDVVGGGMEAGTMLIPEALAEAPLEAGAGLLAGGVTAEGTRRGLEKLGAPPAVTSLVSDISALLAGGVAAHAAGGPGRTRAAGIQDQLAEESSSAAADATREHALQEGGMRADLAAETSKMVAEQQAARSAEFNQAAARAKTTAAAQMTKGQPGSVWDYLTQLQQMGQPPIQPPNAEMLDSFSRVPPVGQPPPQLALPPARATIYGRTGYGGPEPTQTVEAVGAGAPTFAESAPPASPDQLVNTLGEQLSSQLEYQGTPPPRATPETRVKLRERQDYQTAKKSALDAAYGEMDSRPYQRGKLVNDQRTGETYYTPPVGWSDVYWNIIGRSTPESQQPGGAVIKDVLKTFLDTGAESAKDIPADYKTEGEYGPREFKNAYDKWMPEVQRYLDRRTRREMAYEARARGDEAGTAADASSVSASGNSAVESASTHEDASQPGGGPPSLPGQYRSLDRLPDWVMDDVKFPDEPGGYEPEESGAPPSVPGSAAARDALAKSEQGRPSYGAGGVYPEGMAPSELSGEAEGDYPPVTIGPNGEVQHNLPGTATGAGTTPPVAEIPPSAFELKAQEGSPEPADQDLFPATPEEAATETPTQRSLRKLKESGNLSLFDRLKGEEGVLVLDVPPGDKTGLRRWLKKNEAEYGDEDWHQQASDALENDDASTAWRIASIASARSFVAAGGSQYARLRDQDARISAKDEAATAKYRSQIEKSIGSKLPKNVEFGAGGVIKFPGNPGGLEPKFSDVALAKTFVDGLMKEVDPSQIVRVEDEEGHLNEDFVSKNPEMRITAQMADHIVTQMPAAVREAFEADLGLDAAQLGAHFRRAFKQAGQLLNLASQWQSTHWDEILHVDPLTGSTKGPGAAGRLEFLPPERAKLISDYLDGKRDELSSDDARQVLRDMNKLKPKQLAEIGFELPKGTDPEGVEAARYTKNWLTKQRRLVELGAQVEAIAKPNDLNKALVAASLGLSEKGTVPGKIREVYLSLMRARLSFLVSQFSTAFHVLASQGMRYTFGIPEEIFSAAAAGVSGDGEQASYHWALAKNMAKGISRPGSVPMGLVKHPWTDGIQSVFDYSMEMIKGLDPEDVRKTIAGMEEEYPEIANHMLSTLTLGNENPDVPGSTRVINPKITNLLTAGMRLHAALYRSTVADAVLRTQIEMKGDDPSVVLAQPGGVTQKYGDQIGQQMYGAAGAAALDYTQAGDPYPGTFTKWLLDAFNWKSNPEMAAIVRMAEPFPRFAFGSIPRYVWDRMPGTIVADIVRAKFPVFGKGRLGLGLERAQIERYNIPQLTAEHAGAEYTAAKALGDLIQANVQTQQAAQAFKALEARGKDTGALAGIQDALLAAHHDLQTRMDAKVQAKDAYTEASKRAALLEAELGKQGKKLQQLQEIAAPDYHEALARQAMGTLILTGAIGLRASQPDDTKWSDIRIGGKDIDMKWAAGFSQFLLPADVIVDFHRHTDWDVVKKTLETDGYNYAGLLKGMKAGYTGKYTTPEFAKEAAEGFLSLAPVIGGMSSMVDMATGRSAQGTSVLDAPFDFLSTFLGQAMGAFTLPAKQFGDLVGQLYTPEAVSRTPEVPGQYGSTLKELTQPALENIPGVRETIPAKVSPLTGGETIRPLPGLQPLGVSAKVTNQIEREITRTGLPYAAAVPKVTGDREFDNLVARAYSAQLNENFQDVLGDQDYQKLTPELQREILQHVFAALKRGAYAAVADQVGEEAQQKHLASPARQQKLERWQRYADKLQQESAPPEPPPAPEGEPPQAQSQFGQPPPSL